MHIHVHIIGNHSKFEMRKCKHTVHYCSKFFGMEMTGTCNVYVKLEQNQSEHYITHKT